MACYVSLNANVLK